MVWYSHHFKNFPQFVLIHMVKGFSIVSEVDVFFWTSLAFSMMLADRTDAGNLISFLNPALHLEVLGSCTVEA